jgi:hypothetical protein
MGRRHDSQIALAGGGEGFDLLFSGAPDARLWRPSTPQSAREPLLPAPARRWPAGCCGFHQGEAPRPPPCRRGGRRGAAPRGRGWRRRRECAGLLRFALAIDAIDPGLGLPRSSPLRWKGAIRNSVISPDSSGSARPRSSQESILRLPRLVAACNSGTMTTSNSRPLDLWMVINCTPQSLLASGSGRAVSLSRAASRRGRADPARRPAVVQATPEKVEVGAGGRIHAGRAAQPQPDLLPARFPARPWD